MRVVSKALACAFLLVAVVPLTFAADPADIPFDLAALGLAEKPTYMTGPCTVSRNCDYGPPYTISCNGNNTCSSGAGSYGYVACDGVYTYCPPPPPPACTGTCFSSVQCWEICGGDELNPSRYLCDQYENCCRCYYEY